MSIDDIVLEMKNIGILYAEDDEESSKIVRKQLGKWFKNTFVAKNGEDALELFKENSDNIDIFLTDMVMSPMDGIEVAKEIKLLDESIKIVYLTAQSDVNKLIQAIEVGSEAYLLKPVDLDKLYAEFGKIVKKMLLEQLHPISKLPNKKRLLSSLREKEGSLIIIEIANYIDTNIAYGNKMAELVIKQIAEFLDMFRCSDSTLYQVSDSRFAIFLEYKTLDDAEHMVKIYEVVQKEHSFNALEDEYKPYLLYGIASGGDEELYKKALYAVSESKKTKFEKYVIMDDIKEKEEEIKRRFKLAGKIKSILEQNNLAIYYQPIMDNRSGGIVNYECLSRLEENNQIVMPVVFMHEAKLAGMMNIITQQVINKSFEKLANINMSISINLSEYDFQSGDLVNFATIKAKKYRIDPSRVTFEVVEDISLIDSGYVIDQLLELRNFGFKLAIDDFGVDKSNFYKIQNINIDSIKIDGSFIKNLDTSDECKRIVTAIVGFAKDCGVKTVAEYVTSKKILDIVTDFGVDYSQGYFIGKPSPNLL
ncbi:MAG: EAL domain-containing protein [Campylobacterales bacterium]